MLSGTTCRNGQDDKRLRQEALADPNARPDRSGHGRRRLDVVAGLNGTRPMLEGAGQGHASSGKWDGRGCLLDPS